MTNSFVEYLTDETEVEKFCQVLGEFEEDARCVISDKTWAIHYYIAESKRASIEWVTKKRGSQL